METRAEIERATEAHRQKAGLRTRGLPRKGYRSRVSKRLLAQPPAMVRIAGASSRPARSVFP